MKALQVITLVGLLAMTVYNYIAPDAIGFQEPSLARILFWHLPCAILTLVFIVLIAVFGVLYLVKRDLKWDSWLGAGVEMGAVMGAVTMATGIVFSKAQWQLWWQWDPRQTSFLMVLFLFAVGLVLRGGFSDEKQRAAVSSAYSVLTLLPAFFLILVFPRLPQVLQNSVHPTTTVQQGSMDVYYRGGVLGSLLFLSIAVLHCFLLRAKAARLDIMVNNRHGLENGDGQHPTPTGVVRPVALSEER